MGAGQTFFTYKHLTATGVVTAQPQAVLHTFTINTAAATAVVTLYDDNQTASPVAGNVIGIFTVPAGGSFCLYQQLDIVVARGIAVIVATAAADITITYR